MTVKTSAKIGDQPIHCCYFFSLLFEKVMQSNCLNHLWAWYPDWETADHMT